MGGGPGVGGSWQGERWGEREKEKQKCVKETESERISSDVGGGGRLLRFELENIGNLSKLLQKY